MSQANLNGAEVNEAAIAGSWLNLSELVGTEMSRTDLSGSLLFGAKLTGAKLNGAKLNGANLVGADLSGVDLRGADLTGAILILPLPPGADEDFSYQALTGDELHKALGQTDMAKAMFDDRIERLTETRLKPILQDTVLQGVIYNDQTIWPIGFDIPGTAIYME